MENKLPISVVIVAKDEEAHIEKTLKSVIWSDDIIVVVGKSRDRTKEISEKYTSNIYEREQDVEGTHRNWSYQKAKNKWVLSLDGDEVVTPELKGEISILLDNDPEKFAAYAIPLRNYIGTKWVRYGGWYPASKVRLFQKDKFRYEEVGVHPRVFIDGECGQLSKDIIHRGYPTVEHFLGSLNYQTTQEAKKWYDEKRRIGFLKIFRKSADRFLRSFILKRGYKDGMVGFIVAYFGGLYQMMSFIKYRELKMREKDAKGKG